MLRQSTKACCPIFAVFTFEKPLLGLDDFHQMVLLFAVFRLFVRSVLAQLTGHHSEIKRLKLLSNIAVVSFFMCLQMIMAIICYYHITCWFDAQDRSQ